MTNDPFGPWATALSPLSSAKLSTFWVRRLSMLPNLGQSLPILSRQCLYGALVLAAIALVMPSLRGTSSARVVGDDPARSGINAQTTTPGDDDAKALATFLQIYRLAPGQDLKFVESPRPAGVNVWWKRTHPNHVNHPGQFGAMTFSWRDPDFLENWAAMVDPTGQGPPVGFSVRGIFQQIRVNIDATEIDGDPDLLETRIAGDWVFREGVPDERMVAALEPILQRMHRLRIKLAFRSVARDVVVVRGQYHHSPLPGRSKNWIDIYGIGLVKKSGAGGGTGDFSEFIHSVAGWINRPVVSEVEFTPKESITWRYHARSPFTEQMRREDHNEALVLQHLHEQTGLTFTREKKPIRVLFVERPK
jgi:hypothetical protein